MSSRRSVRRRPPGAAECRRSSACSPAGCHPIESSRRAVLGSSRQRAFEILHALLVARLSRRIASARPAPVLPRARPPAADALPSLSTPVRIPARCTTAQLTVSVSPLQSVLAWPPPSNLAHRRPMTLKERVAMIRTHLARGWRGAQLRASGWIDTFTVTVGTLSLSSTDAGVGHEATTPSSRVGAPALRHAERHAARQLRTARSAIDSPPGRVQRQAVAAISTACAGVEERLGIGQ